MIRYKVPATSANIGIGFDCLGLALNIYNYFEIEKESEFILEGFIDVDINDNLFYVAYKQTCEHFNNEIVPLHVKMDAHIPVSRGLGSSSALIVGGIYAYYLINSKPINKEEILKIATKIEGHPDNVAPCINGGMCACYKDIINKFNVSDLWKFYLLIPNYEVKTSEARKVLKQDINIKDAVTNISSALIGVDALVNYDVNKVCLLNNDTIHEPYRKKLIKDYEQCRQTAFKLGAKVFLISGSGSTMLIISNKDIQMNIKDIEFKEVKIDELGAICLENY